LGAPLLCSFEAASGLWTTAMDATCNSAGRWPVCFFSIATQYYRTDWMHCFWTVPGPGKNAIIIQHSMPQSLRALPAS